jgi:hypothetical protein
LSFVDNQIKPRLAQDKQGFEPKAVAAISAAFQQKLGV